MWERGARAARVVDSEADDAGSRGSDVRDQEIRALKAELEERTLTLGELAAANRILKKVAGQSS